MRDALERCAQFEAWVAKHGAPSSLERAANGLYTSPDTALAWKVWQAAWNAAKTGADHA